MSKSTRFISLLLAAIMCFGLIPVGAFAETRCTRTEGGVTIESEYDSAFDYLERYYDGVWRDLHTPRHWIAETGEDVYCIEHTMHSPHGDEYVETNPSMLLQADSIEGLFSIFTFGYPFVTPDGFTADEARQATANAIRFWLSEQGEPGSYQYTNRLLYPDLIRAKPGYEHVLIWADELLEHARNRDTLRYGISFDPAHLDLTNTGSGFSGQTRVTLLNANGGYTIDTISLPEGVTISGYTGNGSETITISAPLSAAGNSFTLNAEALDSRVVDNMTAYVPTSANTQSVFLCASSTQVVASASVTVNTEALGGLKIIKKGDNGALLSGVKFGVYSDNACTQLIAEITTGANGVALLENIAPGTVYVKELSTVAPYIINAAVYTAVIPLNDIIEIEVVNESAKGRIRIEKTAESMSAVHTNDSNWGTIHTPVYTEGGLAGCKFNILDKSGNIVETLVTDENGVAVSKLLPLGTYTVVEIEAPNGYIIDATPHTVTLSYQDQVTPVVSATVRVNNERRRAMLKLKKQSEEYDSESHEFKPIPGIGFTFGLYTAERIGKLPKDALVEVLITDNRGVAQTSADLPAGRYYLKELAAPDPAVILLEVQLPVDLTGNDAVIENSYYYDNPIVNHIFKGKLAVKKIDEHTGEGLAGVVYEVKDSDGKPVCTLATNRVGYAESDYLPAGTYYLREIEAPAGYIISDEVYSVTITMGNSEPVVIQITNRKNEVIISKFDIANSEPLAGAAFSIFNASGEIFASGVTDENGEIRLSGLPAGRYTFVETAAPSGYILSEHIYEFSVDEHGNISGSTAAYNEPTALIIDKIDVSTGKPLANVEFKLLNSKGEVVRTKMTSEGFRIPDEKGDETFRVDSTGHMEFRYLPIGEYSIIETTPAGFIPNGKVNVTIGNNNGISNPATVRIENTPTALIIDKIDVSTGKPLAGVEFRLINSKGEVVRTKMTSEGFRIPDENGDETFRVNTNGHMEFRYLPIGEYSIIEATPAGFIPNGKVSVTVGSNNGISNPATVRIENTPTALIIDKIDVSTGKPLANVEFKLLNSKGEVVRTKMTAEGFRIPDEKGDETFRVDENGHVEFRYLPIGSYMIEEIAPVGFIPNGKINVSIGNDNGISNPATIRIENTPTALIIDKIDVSTGKPLPDVEFKLLNSKGEIVRTKMTAEGFRIPDEKGDETYRVDENGHVEFRYLPIGSYTIVEVTPVGFIPNDKVSVEVGNTNGINNPAQVRIENIPTALIIDKIDVSTGKPLADVEFKLINSKGEVVKTKMTAEGFRIPDEKGDETFRVDANGHAEFRYLPIGSYTVVEVTPVGFIPNDKVSAEIGNTNGIDNPATVRIENMPTALIIDKVDVSTGKPLADVEFRLLNARGETVKTRFVREGYRVPDVNGSETFKVDENGHAEFRYLPIGSYMIEEIVPGGFIPNDKVSVEIGNMNGINNPAQVRIENMPTALIIDKVDVSTGRPIADVEFRLLNTRGETVKTRFVRDGYSALAGFGFKKGNILEPSCGVGNFFGMLPDEMRGSKLYGVELDPLTGRIAKQLYQNAKIAVQGFEETNLPDSFFDVAIGNVPFGDYSVSDKKYDKEHFLIHDYFIAKSLDKVRPGGIVAFVTSSGTLDKKNPAARKYLAKRAELIGAIRLPNNAFQKNAGTNVVTDILFLQKRDRPIDVEPEWVHLGQTEEGYTINQYFIDNPQMILGTLTTESTQYGRQETTVAPIEDEELSEQLRFALTNIHADIAISDEEPDIEEDEAETIPADPSVRNYSFTLFEGDVYFREDSVMRKVDAPATALSRIKGMIELRDSVRKVIGYQLEGWSDEVVRDEQKTLNALYDSFTKKYGLISSRANKNAFSGDSSYSLLSSLEILGEDGELIRKADIFSKRTIRQKQEKTHVDSATEALAVSLNERAKVDLPYMATLTGKTEETIEEELGGIVFRDFSSFNPAHIVSENYQRNRYPLVTADEFLSGNVRQKLRKANELFELISKRNEETGSFDKDLEQIVAHIAALTKVQPQQLTASEIDVRLGATWLPTDIVQDFMYELLNPNYWVKRRMRVQYSPVTAQWNITEKNADFNNPAATLTYGTSRINAYKIIEETLNLKDVRIFDTIEGQDGREVRVLNKRETILAQQKQQSIKDAFKDWVWKDPQRRDRLTELYNERFNSTRPREYDGSHIEFIGMNPEIKLREHQQNAVARIMYGGNTLLAHVVGAGKTFTMAAAAMEMKRLGLCSKSLFVVPNHLIEQWAAEFQQLYPAANLLVATKKDFETANRKKSCSRIATGDYDAVIIGHSQFEKIPISIERQRRIIEEQIEEITDGIQEAKIMRSESFTIKQLEKTKRMLKTKLDKLNDQSRKDDVVTFEELGIDRMFIDEAHNYKNLFLHTKMRNVAGLSQTEAQKSSDMFMKCRYLDELTGNRGTIFATGTPVSNSMTELYTMQRYLQYDGLREKGLQHFDAWASTFGETITAIELAPEGYTLVGR